MNWLEHDLDRYGPEAIDRATPSVSEADAYCRRLARRHYENFLIGSVMLPRGVRPHFHRIYAYCRWADDLADEIDDRSRSLELLHWWRQQLEACYQGRAKHPVFVALRATVRQYGIPAAPFHALLSAFRQDQHVHRYEHYDQLLDYCSRSANPVGHLILYLGNCHEADNVLLADRICTGLQLVNFWQDVSRDHQRDRIYIPREDLRRFGCNETELADRSASDSLRQLIRFEVERTEQLLRSGHVLVNRVPRWLQADIELFVRGGLATLQAIRHVGYDVLRHRPTVSRARQLWLLATVLPTRIRALVGKEQECDP